MKPPNGHSSHNTSLYALIALFTQLQGVAFINLFHSLLFPA